jgi:hypothetical protein
MDFAQFVASIVASIAWPVAIVLGLLLFRDNLVDLLPHLRVKHKDWEASFRLAEKEVAALPPAPIVPEAQPTPEEKSRYEQIAELSPRAAILELRNEIEDAVRTVVERHMEYAGKAPLTLLTATRLLRSHELIDSTTSALLDHLRAIGNNAAHSSSAEFSKDDAMRYRAIADEILPRLRDVSLKEVLK